MQQQLDLRMAEAAGHRVEQRAAGAAGSFMPKEERRTPGRVVFDSTDYACRKSATLVLSRRQYVTAILRSFVANGFIEIVDARFAFATLRAGADRLRSTAICRHLRKPRRQTKFQSGLQDADTHTHGRRLSGANADVGTLRELGSGDNALLFNTAVLELPKRR